MQFFQHDVGEAEIEAVAQAMREGHLTTGAKIDAFAGALGHRFGFKHMAFCNSGTSALHLALVAAGVGPGDKVTVTPYVGVWTVNPILMVGATPVFADIDPETYNLDPKAVAEAMSDDVKAVMPVSVNGVPCDYAGLRSVLPGGVRLICDDIEALGSMRDGHYVGSDVVDLDVSVHGFWVSKQVTTCSGGMVATADEYLANEISCLSRHGHGRFGNMWDQSFGYNYAFPDPLAAMGCVQVERFEEKQQRLLDVKWRLDAHFGALRRQRCKPGHFATEFVYIIELPDGVDKARYAQGMAARGVPVRPYFNDLQDVPHLQQFKRPCPTATAIAKRTIAIPYHWKITQADVEDIWAAHNAVLASVG